MTGTNLSKAVNYTVAVILILGGSLMAVLAEGRTEKLVTGLGLGLIVVGVEKLFRLSTLFRAEQEEAADFIAKKLDQLLTDRNQSKIAQTLDRILRERSPAVPGIRLVTRLRGGFKGYDTWVHEKDHKDLFFAGRSVLHRIDADLKTKRLGSAAEVLAKRVIDGATVRILFIDPRSAIVEQLAKEERRPLEHLLSDIARSLGVTWTLFTLLDRINHKPKGELHICIYDEVPYFAFHKEDNEVIIGFYFRTVLGETSAAYEILDTHTKSLFEGHFMSLFDRAANTKLLEVTPKQEKPMFNQSLFKELCAHLGSKIGLPRAAGLIGETIEIPETQRLVS